MRGKDLSSLSEAPSPPKRPILPQLPESPPPFLPGSNEPTVDPIDFLSLHTASLLQYASTQALIYFLRFLLILASVSY